MATMASREEEEEEEAGGDAWELSERRGQAAIEAGVHAQRAAVQGNAETALLEQMRTDFEAQMELERQRAEVNEAAMQQRHNLEHGREKLEAELATHARAPVVSGVVRKGELEKLEGGTLGAVWRPRVVSVIITAAGASQICFSHPVGAAGNGKGATGGGRGVLGGAGVFLTVPLSPGVGTVVRVGTEFERKRYHRTHCFEVTVISQSDGRHRSVFLAAEGATSMCKWVQAIEEAKQAAEAAVHEAMQREHEGGNVGDDNKGTPDSGKGGGSWALSGQSAKECQERLQRAAKSGDAELVKKACDAVGKAAPVSDRQLALDGGASAMEAAVGTAINKPNAHGFTVLHLAVMQALRVYERGEEAMSRSDPREATKELLRRGADVLAPDKLGKSAWDLGRSCQPLERLLRPRTGEPARPAPGTVPVAKYFGNFKPMRAIASSTEGNATGTGIGMRARSRPPIAAVLVESRQTQLWHERNFVGGKGDSGHGARAERAVGVPLDLLGTRSAPTRPQSRPLPREERLARDMGWSTGSRGQNFNIAALAHGSRGYGSVARRDSGNDREGVGARPSTAPAQMQMTNSQWVRARNARRAGGNFVEPRPETARQALARVQAELRAKAERAARAAELRRSGCGASQGRSVDDDIFAPGFSGGSDTCRRQDRAAQRAAEAKRKKHADRRGRQGTGLLRGAEGSSAWPSRTPQWTGHYRPRTGLAEQGADYRNPATLTNRAQTVHARRRAQAERSAAKKTAVHAAAASQNAELTVYDRQHTGGKGAKATKHGSRGGASKRPPKEPRVDVAAILSADPSSAPRFTTGRNFEVTQMPARNEKDPDDVSGMEIRTEEGMDAVYSTEKDLKSALDTLCSTAGGRGIGRGNVQVKKLIEMMGELGTDETRLTTAELAALRTEADPERLGMVDTNALLHYMLEERKAAGGDVHSIAMAQKRRAGGTHRKR